MSSNALVETEVMSEVCLDELKVAKNLLTNGEVKECIQRLEKIENMMSLILTMGKKSSSPLH